MIGRIWAIALNTFREAARIRVLYGILVLVLGSNLLAIFLGQLSQRDADRVARDIGLAGISLFGSLTAIFLGVFLLYTEVQRRTIHAIVEQADQPLGVRRRQVPGMVARAHACWSACSRSRWPRMLLWQGAGMSSAIVKAVVLSWLEVITVAAIAIFFSSFSTPFLSGHLRARDVGARPADAGSRAPRPGARRRGSGSPRGSRSRSCPTSTCSPCRAARSMAPR